MRLRRGLTLTLATVALCAMTVAGVLFALLVVVSGSVLAPMGLHWAMNGPGSIAAWLVGRRQARGRQDAAESGDAPGEG